MTLGPESTADEVLAGRDLSGHHVVVTGAASGIGTETARSLAAAGASVTITGRNQSTLDETAALIRQRGGADVSTLLFDLASLESVAAGAQALVTLGKPIDVLINNAGVMNTPFSRTHDGFEMQFGTNHLGHFAFTTQVADLFTDTARVVAVASAAHLRATCDLDDLNWESRDYNKAFAYSHSKTANMWFASQLARKWSDSGRSAFSLHPGVITTNLTRHITDADREKAAAAPPSASALPPPIRKSIAQGAATTVWAASSPDLVEHSGAYLVDCMLAKPLDQVSDPRQGHAEWCYDPESAAQLWTASERLTNLTF